ncbi:DUF2750 domain-containing protein [Flavobacterium sp. '19STA2R22 D10 B1']|uniref:DUF2750 domain-containing protein n=1 Tax=Flavobacterium aerium TaxID=3037261 RepID=UPI00278BD252|nr:DUF2750 domain-containing protein [Flavobacterium sp. '19STA2R22 D10 B1']
MLQDAITIDLRHQNFIKKICQTGIVYGLKSNSGFATSSSNDYEDAEGNPVDVICFWSEEALAKACAKDSWDAYAPKEIALDEFIEEWCIGMYNDEILVGTEFDQNMFGYEIEPPALILEIIKELKAISKEIELTQFESMTDLEQQILDSMA